MAPATFGQVLTIAIVVVAYTFAVVGGFLLGRYGLDTSRRTQRRSG